MKLRVCCVAAGVVIMAMAVLGMMPRLAAGDKPVALANANTSKPDSARADDDAAIRKATADFIKAVEKGDANDVASFWTQDGEYISDDGMPIRGRSAIEGAYAQVFAKKKNTKVEISIDSIRFLSKDTAIEEGVAKSYKGDSEQPTTSRYSAFQVREDGRWLMAMLREWPEEGGSLHELDWLIGTWEAKTPAAEIQTAYKWDAKKNSIHCHIAIKGKDRNVAALQILLKDPRNGQLRSWLFDDDGGFGDATWTQDGKRWLIDASGVQADGGTLTARNILTPIDKDTFSWQSTERTLDGEPLSNIPPVKVRRIK
jgi:uncharacterized protein (TIGR02246 family)